MRCERSHLRRHRRGRRGGPMREPRAKTCRGCSPRSATRPGAACAATSGPSCRHHHARWRQRQTPAGGSRGAGRDRRRSHDVRARTGALVFRAVAAARAATALERARLRSAGGCAVASPRSSLTSIERCQRRLCCTRSNASSNPSARAVSRPSSDKRLMVFSSRAMRASPSRTWPSDNATRCISASWRNWIDRLARTTAFFEHNGHLKTMQLPPATRILIAPALGSANKAAGQLQSGQRQPTYQ
jgi:hypothetical protein